MREFFDNIPLDTEEISKERLDNIKTSVLSRVKEEKAMSKKSTIKMVTIAIAAATTAALSAMIASAEQPAPAPTAVENIVENAGKETGGEAAETETGELPGEAEVDGAIEEAPETGEPLTMIDFRDLVCVQSADDPNVYYYYTCDDKKLRERLDDGWTLVGDGVNAIHLNEVFVDE